MHHHFTKTGSGRTRGKLKKVARVHLGEVRARSRELAALRTGQGAAAAQVRTYTKKRPLLFPCWSYAGPYYTRCKQDRFTKTGSGQHTHRESAPKTKKTNFFFFVVLFHSADDSSPSEVAGWVREKRFLAAKTRPEPVLAKRIFANTQARGQAYAETLREHTDVSAGREGEGAEADRLRAWGVRAAAGRI